MALDKAPWRTKRFIRWTERRTRHCPGIYEEGNTLIEGWAINTPKPI